MLYSGHHTTAGTYDHLEMFCLSYGIRTHLSTDSAVVSYPIDERPTISRYRSWQTSRGDGIEPSFPFDTARASGTPVNLDKFLAVCL